ncbi:MAG: adenosine kinase [Alphaproteobacteria bacterium]
MQDKIYDVVGLGNALLDILAPVSDETVATHGLTPGTMSLIDENQATKLAASLENKVEAPGGSAANTIVGVQSFGGKAAFMGRVRDDETGQAYGQSIRDMGIHFASAAAVDGSASGRCVILVTPDAQRTMNTFLGAGGDFGPGDVEADTIQQSKVLYLEGYMFDTDAQKAAFDEAVRVAKQAGVKIALTLSDLFCVERHRDDFFKLIDTHVDVLFANEEEAKALFGTDDFETSLAAAQKAADIAVITRSEKGATLARGDEVVNVPAKPLGDVVDTTGAGDQFAAGVLYGLTQGKSLQEMGALGALAAGEVISHFGPRPEQSLKALAEG